METASSLASAASGSSQPWSRAAGRYALLAGAGAVLLVAQIACSFLARPIFVGFDILAFGLASALFAYRGSRPWWVSAAVVAGPTFVFTTVVVVVALGPEKLSRGIGSSWVLSLALVPFSAVAGAYVARRAADRSER